MKDFDKWNEKKKETNSYSRPMFKERDVWWCKIGLNVGDEQDGKGERFLRPVLVVKKFNSNVFIGLPLSTKVKVSQFYHKIHFKGIDQAVVLSQMKLLDAKRFQDKMGEIPTNEFAQVKKKLVSLIL